MVPATRDQIGRLILRQSPVPLAEHVCLSIADAILAEFGTKVSPQLSRDEWAVVLWSAYVRRLGQDPATYDQLPSHSGWFVNEAQAVLDKLAELEQPVPAGNLREPKNQ